MCVFNSFHLPFVFLHEIYYIFKCLLIVFLLTLHELFNLDMLMFLSLTVFFIASRQLYLAHLWHNTPQTLAMSAAASLIYDPLNAPPPLDKTSSAFLADLDRMVIHESLLHTPFTFPSPILTSCPFSSFLETSLLPMYSRINGEKNRVLRLRLQSKRMLQNKLTHSSKKREEEVSITNSSFMKTIYQ